ncbi:exocyst complex component EXO70A1-like [Andrographis paniculata]|uniref:exocyst complex component EXO70A1-like n=1 Tax=Andrographis paniculata TaxID=175694 RepID=UPI0021E8C629|nr:exocyst complex component EXO70A1-like [Andrographis paniculata]
MEEPIAGIEALSERTATLRESLQKVEAITSNMVSILGSFDHRLSALETAMRPTQMKTRSIKKAHENIDKTIKVVEVILGQFDLARQAEAKILRGPHDDLESYLETVEELKSIVTFLSGGKNSLKSSIGVISQAKNLLGKAIIKLEEEFGQLVTRYSKAAEPDRLYDCLPSFMRPSMGSSHASEAYTIKRSDYHNRSSETHVFQLPVLIPPRIVPLLLKIAQQMIEAGHHNQVFVLYREARFSAMEQTLTKLGVERLSKEDVQRMQWEVLELKIKLWTLNMRTSFKVLFPGEKKVCDQIFEGNEDIGDKCFAEVTANGVAMLFSLGEAVSRSKRLPEKLFVLLDMYDIMREIRPEMVSLFGSNLCQEVRDSAAALTKRLAQTGREMFVDFREIIEKDTSKTSALDGTTHPLTTYVINYVNFLVEYRLTLLKLFKELHDNNAEEQLTNITTRIIQALQTNLEGKAKQYKDPAFSHIFLMNNMHQLVRTVRRSDAKDLLGNDWVQIHRRVVQQHANQYRRVAWAKILQCLTIQGIQSSGDISNVSKSMVKDRFKTFNILFEEMHLRQSQWVVGDSELRESLRLAVAEILLPAYRSFLRRFGPMIQSGKSPQKYIKYTPEDLERMLGEFFEGRP